VEAAQVARNDAIYRAANERIEAVAQGYEVAGPIPFICECADTTCTAVVLLTLAQYERIRAHPTHFLNLPGHELPANEHVDVVRREPAYLVIEKKGRAAEIVRELDPR
jgi:hypothetical protein